LLIGETGDGIFARREGKGRKEGSIKESGL
jgi:hypothetical protein